MNAATTSFPSPGRRHTGLSRSLIILALCISAALLAVRLRPSTEIALLGQARLDSVIPKVIGDWRIDNSMAPVIPDPGTLAKLNELYSETVARTYVNSRGERVMLSLAYGRRQDDTLSLHRPEGCYQGQGFAVRRIGVEDVAFEGQARKVVRLQATLGLRNEPITYWMVVGGQHVVNQTEAKLAQLKFGLRGYIPDGLLFRISSISPEANAAFDLQSEFVKQLLQSVPPTVRSSLLGR